MTQPEKSDIRIAELEAAIRDLLATLERQTLDGKRPGQFSYSANVTMAMGRCRELIREPVSAVEPDDRAYSA